MPNSPSEPLFFHETIIFYKQASDTWIERFESLLDDGKEKEAYSLMQRFFNMQSKVAKKRPEYIKEPPEIGDMVMFIPTRRYVRLMSKSDDGKLSLVKEQMGAYVVPSDKLVRVR